MLVLQLVPINMSIECVFSQCPWQGSFKMSIKNILSLSLAFVRENILYKTKDGEMGKWLCPSFCAKLHAYLTVLYFNLIFQHPFQRCRWPGKSIDNELSTRLTVAKFINRNFHIFPFSVFLFSLFVFCCFSSPFAEQHESRQGGGGGWKCCKGDSKKLLFQ